MANDVRYKYVDSRGVNRALNGDFRGAIADFRVYVAATTDAARKAERLNWMKQLQRGTNPFTPSVLRQIANE